MSSSYSANQYDDAFKPQRMQNWCVAKRHDQRPKAREGHTTFIANDRGHLYAGASKKNSAWPDFKGTWDLPAHLPACSINRTARSQEGLSRLKAWGFDPHPSSTSKPTSGNINQDQPQAAEQIGEGVEQDGAASSPKPPVSRPPSADAAQGESQEHSITGEASPTAQVQASPSAGPAEDTQDGQASVEH